jgi:hypothetical protein
MDMVLLMQEDVMRSLSDTKVKFPLIYQFATDVFDNRDKYNIVYAKVKSGKRLIAETISQYTNKGKDTLNFFFSGLNRKDVKVQFDELKEYHMECYVSTEITRNKQHIIDKIAFLAQRGNEVIIHVDEADYGSDATQILGSFLKDIHQYENVTIFLYTATPYELTSAKVFMENAKVFKFKPSDIYRGDEWFLANNLVCETTEDFVNFTDKGKVKISDTGIEWLQKWVDCPDKMKNWAVVRISTKTNESADGKSSKYQVFKDALIKKPTRASRITALPKKQIREIFPEMKFVPIFVDDKTPFHFGDYESWDGVTASTLFRDPSVFHLIVLNQTSTRSTEWAFHKNLFFYYSYESSKANVTTQIQRQQRVAHHDEVGYGINVITSDIDTWHVSAELMSVEDYVSLDPKNRSVHQRTTKTNESKKKERFFAFENDPYITVLEPTGSQQHPRLKISKDHPELVKRRNHPDMIIKRDDGTIIKNLQGEDLEFIWTNVCSKHGAGSDTVNANVARYILESKFGLSSAWHLCCAWLDKPSKENLLNQDWTKDWDRLVKQYERVGHHLQKDGEKIPRGFAFYLPAMSSAEQSFSVQTKDKSVYAQIPIEQAVEA